MSFFDFTKKKNEKNKSWFEKLKERFSKASGFFGKIFALFNSSSDIDYTTLEALLLDSDIDYNTTSELISKIKEVADKEKIDGIKAREIIRNYMISLLNESYKKFDLNIHSDEIKVLFFCGINGGGKTTSIAKIASLFKDQYNTLLVGCDSFRAAANDQLTVWANKLDLEVFDSKSAQNDKQPTIAYKAIEYTQTSNKNLILIDTSGRMANNSNLMDELKKTAIVLKKHNQNYPQETILVLDGTQGQHIIEQIEKFNSFVPLTGLIVTKLDGIAKGGIIISIAHKYKLPIYFIGIGEKQEDINYFDPEEFVDSLLNI